MEKLGPETPQTSTQKINKKKKRKDFIQPNPTQPYPTPVG